jgi:hypothetical protein
MNELRSLFEGDYRGKIVGYGAKEIKTGVHAGSIMPNVKFEFEAELGGELRTLSAWWSGTLVSEQARNITFAQLKRLGWNGSEASFIEICSGDEGALDKESYFTIKVFKDSYNDEIQLKVKAAYPIGGVSTLQASDVKAKIASLGLSAYFKNDVFAKKNIVQVDLDDDNDMPF